MSDYITGSRDTDFEVLMKLSDHELGIVCKTNKKIRSICANNYFWKRRAIEFYDISESVFEKLKNFLDFTDNKSFYIYLKDKREVLEIYSISTPKYYDYLLNDLNKLKLPEYMNRLRFLRYIKRKIFESTIEGTDYFEEYTIGSDILIEIRNLFIELGWSVPKII